jgi:hypothetical protein
MTLNLMNPLRPGILILIGCVTACSSAGHNGSDNTNSNSIEQGANERLVIAADRLERMGPEFLTAVKSFAPTSTHHGVSVLAHEHNLFLIALDLEDPSEQSPRRYVKVMFASVFIEDGHSYWRLYWDVDSEKDLLRLFGPELPENLVSP